MALAALIAVEEERAVLDDGTAHAVAVDVAVEGNDGTRRIEPVLGVEPLVAQKLVTCPVQAVAAGQAGSGFVRADLTFPNNHPERRALHLLVSPPKPAANSGQHRFSIHPS